MLINISKISLTMLILFTVSCVEPFRPDFNAYEPILTVEGSITDDEGPYEVIISESSDPQSPRFKGITDATVSIIDDMGNQAFLSEKQSGYYYSEKEEIRGIPGRSYKLRIELADGNIYESESSLLNAAAQLDSVYGHKETIEDPLDGREIPGYQFSARMQSDADSTIYIAWRGTETYEYTAEFTIDYTYSGVLKPFPTPNIYKRCWKTQSTHTTTLLEYNPAKEKSSVTVPLHHSHLSKLNIKYSLLTEQYTLEKWAYEYLEQLNTLSESQGSFYDIQPFKVQGNIKNINNPDEFVAGAFFAAGKSKTRIWLSDNSYIAEGCEPNYSGANMLAMYPRSAWPVYITVIEGRRAVGSLGCFDCRAKGGALTPPDFWE